jgi:hypothetical protein
MSCGVTFAAAICGLFEILRMNSRARRWRAALSSSAVLLLTIAPYLLILVTVRGRPVDETAQSRLLDVTIARTEGVFRYLAPQGMEYFLEGPLNKYTDPQTAAFVGLGVGGLLKVVAALSALYYLAKVGASLAKRKEWDPLLLFAVLGLFFTLAYFQLVHLTPVHPHYFMTTWWVAGVFLARLLNDLPKKARLGLLAVLALVIVGNAAFTAETFGSIFRNHGTRGYYYGSSLGETERAVGEICRLMELRSIVTARVDLRPATGSLDVPFVFFSNHSPACLGKSLRFAKVGPGDFTIHYPEAANNARLIVEEGESVSSSRR